MLVRILASDRPVLATLLQRGHLPFWVITVVVTGVIAACVQIPGLAGLFGFASPGLLTVAGVVVVSILAMALIDLAKLLPPLRRTLAVQSQRT